MPFHKILVAYDGSKAAGDALDTALELLKTTPKAVLEVVHVLQFPALIFGEGILTAPVGIRNDYYEASEKVVEDARKRLSGLPNSPRVTMLQGGAAEAILGYAEQNGFDLIVIGNRGLGGIREFFLGSVSHNVVQHATIPVLIVK